MDKGVIYRETLILFKKGNFDEALHLINEYKDSIDETVFFESMGNYHYYKREFKSAIEYFEKAMMQNDTYDCARYHYLAAVHLEAKGGDTEEVERRYRAAIEIEHNFVDAYIDLGFFLVKKKKVKEALECYKKAIELDRTNLRVYANIVNVFKALKNIHPIEYRAEYENAVNEYKLAQKLYGSTSDFNEHDDRYT